MRIRKHAKIPPLLYSSITTITATPAAAASSNNNINLPSSTLQNSNVVCQLNQSPWDVMTTFSPPREDYFLSSTPAPPPPPYQVDLDDSGTGNQSLADSMGDDKSVASMIMSLGSEEREEEDRVERMETAVMCAKTNGHGWHCNREAAQGHRFCDQHFDPAAKKSENKPGRRKRRQNPATDPHEFYYYSGFGPLWGKKRGANRKPTELVDRATPSTSAAATPTTSPATQMEVNGGGNDIKDVELYDYIEEDEDEEEDGRKRVPRLIKARSLKSLM